MDLPEFSSAGGRPRPGQWCKFRLKSPADAERLKLLGAHVSPDGFFVGIFAPAKKPVLASVGRADGSLDRSGGADSPALPDRVVLQTADGHNVAAVYHDKATGSNAMRDVFFRLDDPDLADVHPLTDKGHLPPGYVARTFAGEHARLYRDPLP